MYIYVYIIIQLAPVQESQVNVLPSQLAAVQIIQRLSTHFAPFSCNPFHLTIKSQTKLIAPIPICCQSKHKKETSSSSCLGLILAHDYFQPEFKKK